MSRIVFFTSSSFISIYIIIFSFKIVPRGTLFFYLPNSKSRILMSLGEIPGIREA